MGHSIPRFPNQVGECCQGNELSCCKQVAPFGHAVVTNAEAERLLQELDVRLPLWQRLVRSGFHQLSRFKVDTSTLALGHDRHESRTQAPRLSLRLDVVATNWRP